jgi:hypothetical protein
MSPTVTLYACTVRLHATGDEHTIHHRSATERALTVISLTPYVDIVRTFETVGDPDTVPQHCCWLPYLPRI